MSIKMDDKYFAEGMTYVNGTLVQFTWKSHEGFVYDAQTLEVLDKYTFHTTKDEGWGMTWDACKNEFIVTDGSEYLHFLDPETMAQKRKVRVNRIGGSPATKMNEIEFWRGRVLANVWYEDVILVIHPKTGVVEKEYDFASLWPRKERNTGADVFNGISVSESPDELYVTGKMWSKIFKIKFDDL